MNKLIDWGFAVVGSDERESIDGLIKTLNYFCKSVVVSIDISIPDGYKLYKYILDEYHDKKLHILSQNIDLGDSADYHMGDTKSCYFHANLESIVNWYSKPGQTILLLAADERIDPHDFMDLYDTVYFMQMSHFYQGINFTSFHHFKNQTECIDMYSKYKWGHLIQCRIQIRQKEQWTKGLKPHSGMYIPDNLLYTNIPIYHYKFLKTNGRSWRDQDFSEYPTYFFPNRLVKNFDWRNLPCLLKNGDVLIR